MELTIIIFLLGGLFLGWSLGANDAANVFGTAVGTRMVQFKTAAIICSIFIILGAVISGAGTTETIGKLGAINALPGAFAACIAAGLSVYLMTKVGLPVSTTQAIVGAIVGWNLYSGSPTNIKVLITILSTWVLCPIIAGLISMGLFIGTKKIIQNRKLHILRLDAYTRTSLLLAGAFGAYSLGANNIANVMGVFVPISPFTDINVSNFLIFSSQEQLFLLGGIAIAVGVFTYSNEEGTYGSNAFKDDIPQQVKYDRMDAIMLLQQDISLEKNKKLIGNTERVIIDKYLDEGTSIGRTYRDSPDVDNTVIIDGHHPIGNFLDVKITDVTEYELQASPIK